MTRYQPDTGKPRGTIQDPVWTAREAGWAKIMALPIMAGVLILLGSAAMAVWLWILAHPFRATLYIAIIIGVYVFRRAMKR